MKFIVDAQLPRSLSDFLNEMGHDTVHTLDLPEGNATKDTRIAQLANQENRVVISKDTDFLESYLVKSEPRKLILVKTGNIPNQKLFRIFEENLKLIELMLSRSHLIEISQTDIAEHGME